MVETLVFLVIYSSIDGENWTLVEPKDVPAFLREGVNVEQLQEGFGCQEPDSYVWYIGLQHCPNPAKTIIQRIQS